MDIGVKNMSMSRFIWSLENFSQCRVEVGCMVSSPPFSPVNDNTVWHLCVSPKGVDEASEGHLSVCLGLIRSDKVNTRAVFKISILNAAGEEVNTIGIQNPCQFAEGQVLGSKYYVRRNLLFNESLLPNDKLTLLCDFNVLPESVIIPECRLSDDLLLMFKNQKFTDVTISAGGKEIGAHKAVLAARSPVFAAMFERNMEEKATNRVEIIDLEYKVVREMLIFIYSGKSPNVKKMANYLLSAADKYGLNRLKLICEDTLCSNLSVDNSSYILILADLYNAHSLKAEAINFIISHATEVTETDGWKNMLKHCPSLVSEAFTAMANKQSTSIGAPRRRRKLN
jgi:speckle-type POZ protein